MPAGLIKSANFVRNTQSNWVQVTGRMDGSKWKMDKKDGGGVSVDLILLYQRNEEKQLNIES